MNPEPKKLTRRHRLVFLLRDGLWHGMKDVQEAGGWRYSARLAEMKKDGYKIEARPIFGTAWEYRWNREPEQADLFAENPT